MNGSRASLAHLYRRGGFGGRPEEIDAAVTAAVGKVVGVDPKVALGRRFPSPDFV